MSKIDPSTLNKKINLLGLNLQALQDFFVFINEKPFRAQQVLKWIHQQGICNFDNMLNLSKTLRSKLSEQCEVTPPSIAYEKVSRDGTYKWILQLSDNNCIETVFIPEKKRGTLCISSQVGCGLNCSFCSTGKQGFSRNLSASEIIGQVWVAKKRLQENGLPNSVPDVFKESNKITNVVIMGMGEPLLNFDAIVSAIRIMLDDFGYGLSKYRVTLSTSGLIPAMQKLAATLDTALAVSLHAPNDELRNKLVPVNKKYPLKALMAACKAHFGGDKRRHITMEYIMLRDINDTEKHAKQLIRLLEGIPSKVNLIPFNPFPHTTYECSLPTTMNQFRERLIKAGIQANIRRTRGDDIDAACGQLVGQVTDRTKRSERYQRQIENQKNEP